MARTGRPRSFDRDQALQSAMHLFWRHGYEATSLSRLKAGMGDIASPSFYAAFGSKEALFKEAIDCYIASYGVVTAPLRDRSLAPRLALEKTLRESMLMQTDSAHPPGCLVTLASIDFAEGDSAVHRLLAAERTRNRNGFADCIRRAIAAGELPASTDVAGLTTLLDAFLQGICLQARQGTSRARLRAAIDQMLAYWDGLAKAADA